MNSSLIDLIGDISQEPLEEDNSAFQNQGVLVCRGEFVIVGIRYYPGVAHPGEYVYLVREPSNPYSSNAIRVENVHHEKIGHIKGTQSFILSPLMDKYGERLKIEGTIPRRGNVYTLPISLEFHSTYQELARTRELAQVLKRALKNNIRMVDFVASMAASSSAVVTPTPQAVIETQKVDWNHQQQKLDDIFEKQLESQLQNLPNFEMPSAFKSKLKLFDYQVQGIRFLVEKERNPPRAPFFRQVKEKGKTMHLCEITRSSQVNPPSRIKGTILCDEMGLGKSLQALALILLEPKAGVQYVGRASVPSIMAEEETVDKENSTPSSLPIPSMTKIRAANNTTLKQILKAAKLKASGNKGALVDRIAQGLTANTVTGEHFPESMRRQQQPVPTPLPSSSPNVTLVAKTNKCTLIVCPVTVMANWTHQVQDHVQEGVLNLKVYHGTSRQKVLQEVLHEQVDVLLVSYHTLAADYAKVFGDAGKSNISASGSTTEEPARKKTKTQSIFDVSFHRIILDEAHTIRNPKARPFKAVGAIQATRRLAITGTPFVNRSEDMYSLLSFLQVEPLNQKEIFQRAISKPLQNGQEIGLTRLRTIMGFVSLRRSKQNIPGLKMVDKTVNLATVEFGDDMHKQVYEAVYGTLRVAMTAILKNSSNALGNYSNIFEKLLRLRQACCSGLLLSKDRREVALQLWKQVSSNKSKQEELSPEEGLKLLEKLKGEFTQALPECGICMEEFDQTEGTILKGCGHVFCSKCIQQVLERSNQKCPYCRQDFHAEDIVSMASAQAAANKPVEGTSDAALEFGTPPKIRALLQTIESTVKPDEKAVIFSQFTSYLDIIGSAMKDAGHDFVRIDGSVPSPKRIECIRQFTQDGGPRFILCSLLASGVGINLSRGNHAFLMDCWWNEAIESQAMDRIHRIDQTRPVQVTKFVMKHSIEERIVSLQQTKSLRAKGAMQKLTGNEKRQALLGDLKGLLEIGN